MQTIVLAGTSREVYAWARAQERNLRSVRHVANASSISGRYFDAIVELPSFAKRRDRHAVNAALRALQRRKPSIERTVDNDWVMPAPKIHVPAEKVDPMIFRFSNLPIPEMPLADMHALAVEHDAVEDFGASDSEVSDHKQAAIDWIFAEVNDSLSQLGGPTAEAGLLPGVTHIDTVHDPSDPAQQPKVSPESTPTSSEADSPAPAAETPKPKKKGRRTNEQKAYDEAKAAQEERPGDDATTQALIAATDALRQRHPDDERLAELDDLGF